ncbi:MAG: hypothetical protein H0T59_07295 [Chloroflexi bacterium]|nr:hypothetical protein [Chloroflexota bacterium]
MSTDQTHDDNPGHPGAVAHHKTDDHEDGHGHDDHGQAEEPLGPIDVQAWGAGALGLVIGLAVTACFVLATSVIGG